MSFTYISVLRYCVVIYTANVKEASTAANVSITLHGELSDSGPRPLDDSLTHDTKWLPGQADVFILECALLGDIESVTLEHDGTDKGRCLFGTFSKKIQGFLTLVCFRLNYL